MSHLLAAVFTVLVLGVGGTVGAIVTMRMRYVEPGSALEDSGVQRRVLLRTILLGWIVLVVLGAIFVAFG